MRLVAFLAFLLVVPACDRAQPTAESVNQLPTATAPAPLRGPIEGGVSTVAEVPKSSCGSSCGGSCGGQGKCNGSCGGGMVADQTPAKPVPADAIWTELQVAGIRCGGCAGRIKRALVDQMGVLGVEVDVATAKVRIATVAGIDGRGLAQPVIDGLGYRVQ